MTIYDALAPLGVPVTHPPYNGDAETYIEYRFAGQEGQVYAEGREVATGVNYTVSAYSDGYKPELYNQIKTLLEAAGYLVVFEAEYYDAELDTTTLAMSALTPGAVYG